MAGYDDTIESLAGAGNVTLSSDLTAGGDDSSTAYSGIMSGTGSFSKSGSGTMTLSGANTYSGETTINADTLSVTGSIANSAATINDGGKLIGSGTVFNLTVADDGTFSPGLSPGTLNAGPTTWESGYTINDAIGTKGDDPGWDWLDITGGLNITATSEPFEEFMLMLSTMGVDASNFDNSQDYSWVIATASTGITGFSADKFNVEKFAFTNDLGGGSFGIEEVGNDINLTFTAVPEPSTYALFGIGLLGLIGGWLKKQKHTKLQPMR
ncbi:MAG: autotransporter-associated beta strand repeat-containing protein [Candidatus Ancaeobacter aquaticus]|nr:autotransporter-associated beta strand repeat-containing protein [Candidatus Ancaeobacter aquaticus]